MSIISEKKLHLGELRWECILCKQQQLADPTSPAVVNQWIDQQIVYAKIEPVNMVATLLGAQLEYDKITHKITIRNTSDYLSEFTYLLREKLRDDNSSKIEVFRLHAMKEVDGRDRFYEIDAELISSDNSANIDNG